MSQTFNLSVPRVAIAWFLCAALIWQPKSSGDTPCCGGEASSGLDLPPVTINLEELWAGATWEANSSKEPPQVGDQITYTANMPVNIYIKSDETAPWIDAGAGNYSRTWTDTAVLTPGAQNWEWVPDENGEDQIYLGDGSIQRGRWVDLGGSQEIVWESNPPLVPQTGVFTVKPGGGVRVILGEVTATCSDPDMLLKSTSGRAKLSFCLACNGGCQSASAEPGEECSLMVPVEPDPVGGSDDPEHPEISYDNPEVSFVIGTGSGNVTGGQGSESGNSGGSGGIGSVGGRVWIKKRDLYSSDLDVRYHLGASEERIPEAPYLAISQILSPTGLTVVKPFGSGKAVEFYPLSAVGDKENGEYTVIGQPVVRWVIEHLGEQQGVASAEIREQRPVFVSENPDDATAPSSWEMKDMTYVRYDQKNDGTLGGWWTITRGSFSETGARSIEFKRSMYHATDGTVKGVVDFDQNNEVIAAWGVSGDSTYPDAIVRGWGSEAVTENFFYAPNPTGLKKLVLRTKSDGSWVRYLYPSGLNSADRIIIRPYKDSAMTDSLGDLSVTTSSMLNTGYVTTDTAAEHKEEAPDENGAMQIVRRETRVKTIVDEMGYAPYEKVVTTVQQGTGMPDLVSQRTTYAFPSDPNGAPQANAGRVYWEQDVDGRMRLHSYLSGDNGQTMVETIDELEPDGAGFCVARVGVSHRTVRTTDVWGNLTSEALYLCSSEGNEPEYTLVNTTTNDYDEIGHLKKTFKDSREVYSATWTDGRMTEESDEFGQVTNYSNFNANAQPLTVIRAGASAANGMPAISSQTVSRLFDVADRLISETTSGGGLGEAVATDHDTAGRIKTQTSHGMTIHYSYPNGGRDVVKTFPGGITETTERFLDGRIKSVTRKEGANENHKTTYEYSVTADGNRVERVTRGIGTDSVWTQTTRNLAGYVIKEEGAGDNGAVIATSYSYDALGHLSSEQRTGCSVKTYSTTLATDENGNLGTLTASTQDPGNGMPTRLTSRHESEVVENAEVFRVVATERGTTKEKIGGFAGNESSKSVSIDLAGNQSMTTMTVDRESAMATTSVSRPDATNQAVTISRLGLLQSTTSFSGAMAIITYDGLRRPITQTDSLGLTTTTGYDPVFGQVESVTRPGMSVQRTYYDEGRNVGRVKSQTTNGQTVYYNYDAAGRLTHQWGPATYPVRYDYDSAGRLSKLHTYGRTASEPRDGSFGSGMEWPSDAGDGHVTTWSYVSGSRLLRAKTDTAGKAVTYTYDSAGRVTTRTWARGVVTNYTYYGTGDLQAVGYSDETPAVAYAYDAKGRMTALIDTAGTHSYTYDAQGVLDTETVAGGQLSGMILDVGAGAGGRMEALGLQFGGGTLTAHSFGYDSATGRMSTVSGDGVTATYGYRSGRDQVETTTITGNGGADLLTHTRTFDGDRLVSVIAAKDGTTVESYSWGYDGAGRRESATLATGDRWEYSYNTRSEVTGGVRKSAAGNVLPGYEFGYSFDAIGNRMESWREATGSRSAYEANALNQYLNRTIPGEVRVEGQSQPGTAKVSLQLEGQPSNSVTVGVNGLFSAKAPVNNATAPQYPELTLEAVEAGGTTGTDWRQIQRGHRFVAKTPEVFTHDLDGNLTSDGRWTYDWDCENRLIGMETQAAAVAVGVPKIRLDFAYDARHRRIRKVLKTGWDGTDFTRQSERKFLYDDGWNLLAEVDGNGAAVATYLWGLDMSGSRQGAGGVCGLLAERINGRTYLPSYDGNGNIVRLTPVDENESDTIYEYGPFGEILRATGPMAVASSFQFSTHYWDKETDAVYAKRRYYAASSGRWLSRDPIEEEGGIHLYNFVLNSPVHFVDPLGLVLHDAPIVSTLPIAIVSQLSNPRNLAETGAQWPTEVAEVVGQAADGYFDVSVEGEMTIKMSALPTTNLQGPAEPGRTIEQHERHHAAISIRWWKENKRSVDPIEGGYCTARCAGIAKDAGNAINLITYYSSLAENMKYDWDAYMSKETDAVAKSEFSAGYNDVVRLIRRNVTVLKKLEGKWNRGVCAKKR